MITLIDGQELKAQPGYYVFRGGIYNPGDLVLVYTDNPSLPVLQCQAYYIETGEPFVE